MARNLSYTWSGFGHPGRKSACGTGVGGVAVGPILPALNGPATRRTCQAQTQRPSSSKRRALVPVDLAGFRFSVLGCWCTVVGAR
jgi:hypothetical protein